MSEQVGAAAARTRPRVAISHALTSPSATALLQEALPPLIETTVQSVDRCGGAALPIDAAQAAGQLTAGDDFDALIILGGGDLDPAVYGCDPLTDTLYGVDKQADLRQMSLVRSSIERGVPVLGICRGMQIITAATGGTLVQDLGARSPHQNPAESVLFTQHDVDVAPHSHLDTLHLARPLNVYSAHHQAVDDVPRGFTVAATGPDGVIEAIELADPWVLGVQWHPEADPDVEDSLDVLVSALVRAVCHHPLVQADKADES